MNLGSIDVVYTWVDDNFPGYSETLLKYAHTGHDLNPNRTRDNLDLMKFSLRSIELYAPWIRHVYIVTSRPHVPPWLNTNNDKISIVHHDEIIENKYLPTFNSFSILSHIHNVNGLSDYFLYIEDDMLFGNTVEISDFISEDKKIIIYPRLEMSCPSKHRNSERKSPWNSAHAFSNYLLDDTYQYENRNVVNHVPFMIDKQSWQEMIKIWENEFMQTRACRFRANYNIVPEFFYLYFMLYNDRAISVGLFNTYSKTFYLGADNYFISTLYGINMIRLLRPKMYSINDNFGDNPETKIVARIRQFLENFYPEKSAFEK